MNKRNDIIKKYWEQNKENILKIQKRIINNTKKRIRINKNHYQKNRVRILKNQTEFRHEQEGKNTYDCCKHLDKKTKLPKDIVTRKYHYHSSDRYTILCQECAKFNDSYFSKVKFSTITLEEIQKFMEGNDTKNQSKTSKSFQTSGRTNI